MKKYIQINKTAYNILSDEYKHRMHNKSKYEERPETLAAEPVRLAKKRFKQVNVLEIGPGSGDVCKYFEDHECKTTAIDVAENILLVTKETSPKTKLICADILSYKLKNKYEIIYCGALIHLFTVADAKRIMNKLYSALRTEGLMYVNTTINDESCEGFYEKSDYNQKISRYRHKYTEHEFKELVENAGFKLIKRKFTDEKSRNKKWVGFVCEK